MAVSHGLVIEAWLCCQDHVKNKGGHDPLARRRDGGAHWAPESQNYKNKDGINCKT